MSTRKRQVFSPEFKREAVALLEKGDKNVAQLARELGVKRTHLHRWREELDTYGRDAFPGVGKRNKQTPSNETARLRAENRRLQEENEILKKAAIYLCERSGVRFAFITDHASYYRITQLCSAMNVSRRGYYDWLNRPDSARAIANRELLVEIKRLFYQSREVYGAPRIYHALLKQGVECGLNRVARLMRENKLVPKTVKKFRATTDSRNSRNPTENLLDRQFTAGKLNEKRVADVTYIPTREGWLYLASVLDLYSRKIVGWSMSNRLTSQLVQKALQNAVDARQPALGLLVHSDRGKEYYAAEYQQLLTKYGLICRSRRGECHDNAVMESFFHSMKVENIYGHDFKTRAEARARLFEYIEVFYNRQRLHSSNGYESPIEYEKVA